MAEEKSFEFLAIADDKWKCRALDIKAVIESDALQLEAIGGQ